MAQARRGSDHGVIARAATAASGSRSPGAAAIRVAMRRERAMNSDRIAGNWKRIKGKVREQWGRLTDDDLAVAEGKRDQLLGRIQERYGITRERAEQELKAWESRL
jgi:uncharacterized protein YjbJ (UPF0337 family)